MAPPAGTGGTCAQCGQWSDEGKPGDDDSDYSTSFFCWRCWEEWEPGTFRTVDGGSPDVQWPRLEHSAPARSFLKHTRRRILVLRHGSRPDRGADPLLNPQGRWEAEQVAAYIQQEEASLPQDLAPIAAIFCSPFRRALETAAPVAQALGLPICVEWGFCELLAHGWLQSSDPLPGLHDRDLKWLPGYEHFDMTYETKVMPVYPDVYGRLEQGNVQRRSRAAQRHRTAAKAALSAVCQGSLLVVAHGSTHDFVCEALCPEEHLVEHHSGGFCVPHCALTELFECGGRWSIGSFGHTHWQEGWAERLEWREPARPAASAREPARLAGTARRMPVPSPGRAPREQAREGEPVTEEDCPAAPKERPGEDRDREPPAGEPGRAAGLEEPGPERHHLANLERPEPPQEGEPAAQMDHAAAREEFGHVQQTENGLERRRCGNMDRPEPPQEGEPATQMDHASALQELGLADLVEPARRARMQGLVEACRSKLWLLPWARDSYGHQPLHLVATAPPGEPAARAARALVAAGAEVDSLSDDSETPLMLAVRAAGDCAEHKQFGGRGRLAVVAELLRLGASAAALDPASGETALMEAVDYRDAEVCRLLLRGRAEPLARTRDGRTAFDVAMEVDWLDEAAELMGSYFTPPRYDVD